MQISREGIALSYSGNWAELFANWEKSRDKESENARQQIDALAKQNRELLQKIDMQKEQIQRLIDELSKRVEQEKLIEQKRAKLQATKKLPVQDAVTPEDFQLIINGITTRTAKNARIKVALTLLYLTGLRVTNLLEFFVSNLLQLMEKYSTLVRKRGGVKKVVIPVKAKYWFQQIESDIQLVIQGKGPDEPVFTNKNGQLISRVQFNLQLNDTLKAVTAQTGKRIYTDSFRVNLVTELPKAVQHVYNNRRLRASKTNTTRSKRSKPEL